MFSVFAVNDPPKEKPTSTNIVDQPKEQPTTEESTPTHWEIIIEQWYTDPYDRPNGEGPAPQVQRHRNLLQALKNQGFHQDRASVVANWLMRCKGRWRDLDGSRKKGRPRGSRNKKGRKGIDVKGRQYKSINPTPESRHHGSDPTSDIPAVAAESNQERMSLDDYHNDNNRSHDTRKDEQQTLYVNTPCAEPTEDTQDAHNEIDDEAMPTAEEIKQLMGDQSTMPETTFSLVDDEQYQDWYIEALKRRLKFWDIVYGDQLPEPDPDLELKYYTTGYTRLVKRENQMRQPPQSVVVANVPGNIAVDSNPSKQEADVYPTAPDSSIDVPEEDHIEFDEESDIKSDPDFFNQTRFTYVIHVIKVLRRDRRYTAFRDPIDTVKLNIPHYYSIVKRPMDLCTVLENVQKQRYKNLRQFSHDFYQIIRNCVEFNTEDHKLTKIAFEMEETFKMLMLKMPSL